MTARRNRNEVDFFRELYLDTDGVPGRGRMIHTIARRLGITSERAENLAARYAELGLIDHRFGAITLTHAGWQRVQTIIKKEGSSSSQARTTSRRDKAQSPADEPQPRAARLSAKPRGSDRSRRTPRQRRPGHWQRAALCPPTLRYAALQLRQRQRAQPLRGGASSPVRVPRFALNIKRALSRQPACHTPMRGLSWGRSRAAFVGRRSRDDQAELVDC